MTKHESLPRFRPYPAYKDSGVAWLGAIPSNWGLKRLKRIVEFRGGGTPSKDNLAYWSGDIPWVSPKDMKVSVVIETEDKITSQAIRESATRIVPAGSVLIVVRSGILIHSIPVALAGLDVTLNQDMKALMPSSAILPKYLMYFVSGMQRELLAEWKREGATVESLELDLVANTPIPLPTIAEQDAIAAFLDSETARIDALVAKKERLIELLDEARNALITKAVTNGLDAEAAMKDSGIESIGLIPAQWELRRLGQLLHGRPRNGVSPPDGPNGATPTFSTAAVADGTVDIDENIKYTEIGSREATPFLVHQGDVLMLRGSGSRALVGKAGIVAGQPPEGCIYPDILIRIRPSKELTSWFLVTALNSRAMRHQIEWAAKTATGIWKITAEDVRNLFVPVPCLDEQTLIKNALSETSERLKTAKVRTRHAIYRLTELRTALISAVVIGKIDVRVEVA